jgi:dienelactone hydrolase
MTRIVLAVGWAGLLMFSFGLADQPLAGTAALTIEEPLDVVMVRGIDRFALREIQTAQQLRDQLVATRDFSSPAAYESSLGAARGRLAKLIGVVDQRVAARGIEFVSSSLQSSLVAENDLYSVHAVRWPVLEAVSAEGLWLQPKTAPIARVVAIPDADWTPEMICGIGDCDTRFAADLAACGCEVLVPTLINRDHKFSGNAALGRTTNLTHREFIYRQAFELGRHVIGYEVQKVLAAVDQFELRNESSDLPIVVVGCSEGGLLAMHSAALDNRIDAVVVSGYFDSREHVWQEPIYRNVWGLLQEFGDAEIAGLIAPRYLYVEQSPKIPEVAGPPAADRNVAAPGAIKRPNPASVAAELGRAVKHWQKFDQWPQEQRSTLEPSAADLAGHAPLTTDVIRHVIQQVTSKTLQAKQSPASAADKRPAFSSDERQQRQVNELVQFTQKLLRDCYKTRDLRFAAMDRTSVAACVETSQAIREQVYQELIGKLPDPTMDANPRSRQIIETADYTGHEVVLDVYPDVIASGILLLPNDLKANEKRPVVVCQHGLEGTPMDTISGADSDGYYAYKSFSAELAKRGFIVYAPQNPYRGQDAFRTLQRKSNPVGRSLFSYIIPQHLVTLRWLSSLPNVDSKRIAFYGLSYGGKTAMRVPPLLPPTSTEPGYCLSICSADFNEWVTKNATVDANFSYVWTGEYEIFEWNMGHVANYAELAMLMTPRPFMVERGHDDGVGIDEWVAWEFAKVRRHYNKLGLSDQAEIEFFDGPHTINGQGSFAFLHRHLNWPTR